MRSVPAMNTTRGFRAASSFCLIGLVGLLVQLTNAAESYTENPGADGDGNFTVGPEYKLHSDLTEQGNPKGKFFEFTMRLADSKIFRGDDTTLEPEKKKTKTGSETKETVVSSVKEIKAKAKKPVTGDVVVAKTAGPAKKRKPKSKE